MKDIVDYMFFFYLKDGQTQKNVIYVSYAGIRKAKFHTIRKQYYASERKVKRASSIRARAGT